MRTVALLAGVGSLVLLLSAWTAGGAPRVPPKCSSADTQRKASLTSGSTTGGPGYQRSCGPGRAVVRFGGRSFTIHGGRCGKPSDGGRWLWFGLFANGASLQKNAMGFSIVMERGDRPGSVKVIDSIVQVAGLNAAPRGTTTVAKGLKSGTFALVDEGPGGKRRFTGTWTCA